ncbi:MAG: hypothetical protein HQM14_05785 [SAR324 cluster bacterium]|nr:hypothetical protein [SAR324 cluster bacterium]
MADKIPILWFELLPIRTIIIPRRWWVVFFSVLLLTGCTLKIAYQYADWIALWAVDDYFDLSAEQKTLLEEKVQRHLTWHKQNELHKYSVLLKEFKQKGQDGLEPEEIEWCFTKIEYLRKNLVQRLLTDTSVFLAGLTQEQIEFFETQLMEFNESALERVKLPQEERRQRRVDRTLEFSEDWFGQLSANQQEKISQLSRQLPETFTERIKIRKIRQKEFLELLRSGSSAKAIETQLAAWFLDVDQSYPPHYQQMIEKQKEAVKRMMLSIDQILTPEQRTHAIEKIDEWIEDIDDIISS